jgi:hypothetical protein
MVGRRHSYNSMHAEPSGNLPDASIALRPAFGAQGLGYLTTATTMRWLTPVALRGGGLD